MAASANSADNLGNRGDVEFAWAVKAYHHAETYFNLISSVDSTGLRLTKHDDELYQHFKQDFPDMKIDRIHVDHLKSDTAKTKWRVFCNHFDGTIDDFNFGTLLRLNCSEDYSEENSLFVTRVQFFAIEVARNREGLNQAVRKAAPNTETKPTTPDAAPNTDEEALQSTKPLTPLDDATKSVTKPTTPDAAPNTETKPTSTDAAPNTETKPTTSDAAPNTDEEALQSTKPLTSPDATKSDQVTS